MSDDALRRIKAVWGSVLTDDEYARSLQGVMISIGYDTECAVGDGPSPELMMHTQALVKAAIMLGVRGGCRIEDDRSGLRFEWRVAG